MNIFKLERSLQTDFNKSVSIETIRLKYEDYMNSLSFKTNPGSEEVFFTRTNQYRGEALKVFRDGHVSIFIQHDKHDKLNINWSVELDILYYLSGLTEFIMGFTVNLIFNSPLFLSIIIGLIGTILTIIIGIFNILDKTDEINSACLEL